MAKFLFTELVNDVKRKSARLGSDLATNGGAMGDAEMGKFVKLVGDSRYGLAAKGDEIEYYIHVVEAATMDGYSFGGVARGGHKRAVADGSQANGTGNLAVGDYLVVGTVVPRGTSIASVNGELAKVCKATDQAAAKASPFACRVASLGDVGSGAPGTEIIFEFVTAQ